MDIFESLDNLNVSEECLGDIIGLVKAYLNEKWGNNSGRKRPWFSGDSHDKDYAKVYVIFDELQSFIKKSLYFLIVNL